MIVQSYAKPSLEFLQTEQETLANQLTSTFSMPTVDKLSETYLTYEDFFQKSIDLLNTCLEEIDNSTRLKTVQEIVDISESACEHINQVENLAVHILVQAGTITDHQKLADCSQKKSNVQAYLNLCRIKKTQVQLASLLNNPHPNAKAELKQLALNLGTIEKTASATLNRIKRIAVVTPLSAVKVSNTAPDIKNIKDRVFLLYNKHMEIHRLNLPFPRQTESLEDLKDKMRTAIQEFDTYVSENMPKHLLFSSRDKATVREIFPEILSRCMAFCNVAELVLDKCLEDMSHCILLDKNLKIEFLDRESDYVYESVELVMKEAFKILTKAKNSEGVVIDERRETRDSFCKEYLNFSEIQLIARKTLIETKKTHIFLINQYINYFILPISSVAKGSVAFWTKKLEADIQTVTQLFLNPDSRTTYPDYLLRSSTDHLSKAKSFKETIIKYSKRYILPC